MFRVSRRPGLTASLCTTAAALAASLAPQALGQSGDIDDAWADFNHYVLVARADLAAAAADTLLNADPDDVLAAVEAGTYDSWPSTLVRAQQIDALAESALQLDALIQAARIEKARDPQRIAGDIAALDDTQRAYRNAVERLTGAGQFAAPAMLAALLDDDRDELEPYILSAFEAIGRPVAYPLAVALPDLPSPHAEQIAQVLATIGYPDVAPYLKLAIESGKADPGTTSAIQVALDRLAERSRMSFDAPAAELFYQLALKQYNGTAEGQPGFDPGPQDTGLLWRYTPEIGLVPITVPAEIYPDTLAMDSTKQSLALDSSKTESIELYLAANLRRENRLPVGQTDPSYPVGAEPAAYYARLAGPMPVQAVLMRAINDSDASLALDAVQVLNEIAGTDSLVEDGSARQPILDAISSPDRRVRFAAATALGQVRPNEAFTGSGRVVPSLADAVRQGDSIYAVALAGTQERVNELTAALETLGYVAIGATSVSDLNVQLGTLPGVDAVVAAGPIATVRRFVDTTDANFRLGSSPFLALVSPDAQADMLQLAREDARITVGLDVDDVATLDEALQIATAQIGLEPIGLEEGTELAIAALDLLRELAEQDRAIYRVSEAESILIAALGDERPEIVLGSAHVLALIESSAAQQAIADTAVLATGSDQITLLGSLAESAKNFGNLLDGPRQGRIVDLAANTTGELAEVASKVYGSLGLPTEVSVEQVLAD
ncbi:MAG: HEAT repeat domain-containing protein [Planctomycetota bacterium]